MDNSFFAYLQQLELMAFFSGYPLLYAVILFIAGNQQSKNNFKSRIVSLLPFAYALVGTLYLGLQIKNLYPDYSIENIKLTMQQPWLITWGILSILFWIPALGKKPVLSLIHSLVFFFFLVRDLVMHSFQSSADKSVVRNDMKIYTDSLLLNMGAFAFIVLLSFLFARYKKRLRS
jgi:hypothetical protein